ncbi:MAG: hypothetical protein FIB06_01435 [Betaproteobacteria bacterium]|nr:hypothetical protein [Betaproteobacteria bacterium]
MNWLKAFFRRSPPPPAEPEAPRPADWNLTLDALFAEVKAGRRAQAGAREIAWARAYEVSLLPPGTRFPRKGDVYAARADTTVSYMTAWAAPYTGGGDGTLYAGERICIHVEPADATPVGTYAVPVEHATVERRMVPEAERTHPKYGGFYLFVRTLDLTSQFDLVSTEGEAADGISSSPG